MQLLLRYVYLPPVQLQCPELTQTTWSIDIAGFRSVAMDTWLIEEYLFQSHDPAVCLTLKRNEPYGQDPLSISKFSVLHRRFLMLSVPDWMEWATSNKIEYFGTVIDEKLVGDFKSLKIGIQPTEETTASDGAKWFQDRVEEYRATLGFNVVADEEQDADGDADDSMASEEEADIPDEVSSDSSSDSDLSDPPRRSHVSGRRCADSPIDFSFLYSKRIQASKGKAKATTPPKAKAQTQKEKQLASTKPVKIKEEAASKPAPEGVKRMLRVKGEYPYDYASTKTPIYLCRGYH